MSKKMETAQQTAFEIGEKYTNEKGVFEVMSIKRNDMVIRWADGKEVDTTVDFQLKIQERRLWEQTLTEKKGKTPAS